MQVFMHAGGSSSSKTTVSLVRGLPEGADIDADTIQLVSELLLAELG